MTRIVTRDDYRPECRARGCVMTMHVNDLYDGWVYQHGERPEAALLINWEDAVNAPDVTAYLIDRLRTFTEACHRYGEQV